MKNTALILLSLFFFLSCAENQKVNEQRELAPIPHLEKRGDVTQLIVEGKPYLALAMELTNSAASSREYMKSYWPQLKESGVNTVLADDTFLFLGSNIRVQFLPADGKGVVGLDFDKPTPKFLKVELYKY